MGVAVVVAVAVVVILAMAIEATKVKSVNCCVFIQPCSRPARACPKPYPTRMLEKLRAGHAGGTVVGASFALQT